MKLKHIFSVLLISVSTVSFASAIAPVSNASIQLMSKIKPSSPAICSLVLKAMSDGCNQQYPGESVCNDKSFLDRSLRDAIVMSGGVENLCQHAENVNACKILLTQYLRQCPIL